LTSSASVISVIGSSSIMLGVSGTRNPVVAHIVLLARERGWPVLSSDAADLLAIDPTLHVEEI
jgi:hypothetical protein